LISAPFLTALFAFKRLNGQILSHEIILYPKNKINLFFAARSAEYNFSVSFRSGILKEAAKSRL
jgi:hypothetical protein